MSRISTEPPRTLLNRLVARYSRRVFGRELGPARAAGHNRRVLLTTLRVEAGSARWNTVDPGLKLLATMAAATTIGCRWCLDFGHWLNRRAKLAPEKITALPHWREAEVYTPLERQVLAYAEAMTVTPPAVTDAMVDGLRAELDDAQLVELTATIALENLYGRNNDALGLAPEGFRAECAVPERSDS